MKFQHVFYIFCCIFLVTFHFVHVKPFKNLRKQLFIITCLNILTLTLFLVWEKENLAMITFGLTGILFKRTIAQVVRRHSAWENFKRVKRKAKLHISWKEPEPVKNSFQEVIYLVSGIVLVIFGLLRLLGIGASSG